MLYVTDRAQQALTVLSHYYNDTHHLELEAGASTYQFTIPKTEDGTEHLIAGNRLLFTDDKGKPWAFTILNTEEKHNQIIVYAEDVGIELINKMMPAWPSDGQHGFEYYFDKIIADTDWELGVNEISDLSRTLTYTGRDTGLGRLLSILNGFDNAEVQFEIKTSQLKVTNWIVNVYKKVGADKTNQVQMVYSNEINDITRKESRAEFVTKLAGVGSAIEGTDLTNQEHITFADIQYDQDGFYSPKGDQFIYAKTANQVFNPDGHYIEDYYDYDTSSAQELFNRTLSQLKTRSEPSINYAVDATKIDSSLEIGDYVAIIDHDFQPAQYIQARILALDKSYREKTINKATFGNYKILKSNLLDQLTQLRGIISQMPNGSTVNIINNVLNNLEGVTDNLQQQIITAVQSADDKSTNYLNARPSNGKEGDLAFMLDGDHKEIWQFIDGNWTKIISDADSTEIKNQIAKQQDEIATVKSDAATGLAKANDAINQAGFASGAAQVAQSAAIDASSDAKLAFGQATDAYDQAGAALTAAGDAKTTAAATKANVDELTGTVTQLTNQTTVLDGKVTTTNNLAQQAVDGLKFKADTTTVSALDGKVTSLGGQLDVQADKIAAKVTANDVTGMLGGYATQSWSQGILSAAKNEITASVETVRQTVDNMQIGVQNLIPFSEGTAEDATHWQSGAAVIGTVIESSPVFILDGDATTNGFHRKFANLQKDLVPKLAAATKYYVSFEYRVEADSLPVNLSTNFAIRTTLKDGGFKDSGLSLPDKLNTGQWYKSAGFITTPANMIDTMQVSVNLGFNGRILFRRLLFAETNTPINWLRALSDYATTDWTKSLLDVSEGKVSAQVQSVKTDLTNTLNNNIANATAGMATQTWTQGKLDLTAEGFTSQISSVQKNIDNMQIGGTNLITGTSGPFVMGWGIPNTTWNITNQVSGISLPVTAINARTEVLPQGTGFPYTYMPGVTYTQSIFISTDAPLTGTPISFDWYANTQGHDTRGSDNLVKVSTNLYRATSTYTWPSSYSPGIGGRNADLLNLTQVFDFTKGTFLQFYKPKLEHGNKATDWSPAPEDQATVVQFTSIEQTLKGIQLTANNAVTQAQLTLLSDQFTSKIGPIDLTAGTVSSQLTQLNNQFNLMITGDPNGNLIKNSTFVNSNYWTAIGDYEIVQSGDNKISVWSSVAGSSSDLLEGEINTTDLKSGDDITLSLKALLTETSVLNIQIGDGPIQTKVINGVETLEDAPQTELRFKYTSGNTIKLWANIPIIMGFESLMLVKGTTVKPWAPAGGGIKSQINLDQTGVLIEGENVRISGKTTIDDAVITDAMIGTVSASKLTAGTIDASQIDVININAANINAGSLSSLSSNTGDLRLTGTFYGGPYYTDHANNSLDPNNLPSDLSNVYVSNWAWTGKKLLFESSMASETEASEGTISAKNDARLLLDANSGIAYSVKQNVGGNLRESNFTVMADYFIDPGINVKNMTLYMIDSYLSIDENSAISFQGTSRNGIILDKYGNVTSTNTNSTSWGVFNKNNVNVLRVTTDASNLNVTAKAFVTTSKLSTKMDITPLTPDDAVAKLLNTDIYAYRYIDTGSQGQTFYSPIIDDLHRSAQYRVDDNFVTDDRESRIDGNMVGALVESVKYFKVRIDNQEGLIKNLQQQIIDLKSA